MAKGASKFGGKGGKGKSGLAGKMKIKAGPGNQMTTNQTVTAQKPFETATTAKRSSRSYAK
jgi:hypothetical protein